MKITRTATRKHHRKGKIFVWFAKIIGIRIGCKNYSPPIKIVPGFQPENSPLKDSTMITQFTLIYIFFIKYQSIVLQKTVKIRPEKPLD